MPHTVINAHVYALLLELAADIVWHGGSVADFLLAIDREMFIV